MRDTSASPPVAGPQPKDPEFLQAVLNTAGLAAIVLDPDGHICLFSPVCESLTGYSASEVLGRNFSDLLIPPEQRDEVDTVFGKLVAGDYPNEYENDWLARSGERRRLHWHNTVLTGEDGQIDYIVCTGIDITGQRDTERELRHSAQEMRRLVDNSPALIAHLDTELHFVFANESYQRWFGMPMEELAGRHVREVIGDEAFATLAPQFQQALDGETVTYDGEIPYKHAGARIIHGTYVPHFTGSGRVDGLFIMAIDLTEQRRLASALSATNRRNQAVLDTAVDGIITINEKGIVESFNRSAERIFGYRPSEVIGNNVKMLMPSPHAEQHDGYLQRYLNTGERRIIGIGREVNARRKDGTVFPIELAVGEFYENGRHYFTGFTRDITDRKRIEQESRERLDQLAHVARQNSLGIMTSGLAHEINQPLAAIVTTAHACLRLLQNERASPEVLQKSLNQIAKQGERASNIIAEMRQFLRSADTQNRTVQNVNELIPGVLDLLAHELTVHSIDVAMKLHEELPSIPVNQVQIEQILLNLIRNAIEALADREGERRIEIESDFADADRQIISICVADNGPGLPQNVLDRLFEPFVTTKDQGLGQGLAISRSIARAHNGDLHLLNNDMGEGAHFCITLPVQADTD